MVTATRCACRSRARSASAARSTGPTCWCWTTRARRVAHGAVGELWIAGPQVADGYVGDPELTGSWFATEVRHDGHGPPALPHRGPGPTPPRRLARVPRPRRRAAQDARLPDRTGRRRAGAGVPARDGPGRRGAHRVATARPGWWRTTCRPEPTRRHRPARGPPPRPPALPGARRAGGGARTSPSPPRASSTAGPWPPTPPDATMPPRPQAGRHRRRVAPPEVRSRTGRAAREPRPRWTPTQELVLRLVAEVLAPVGPIDLDDDFLDDLGGTSLAMVRLLSLPRGGAGLPLVGRAPAGRHHPRAGWPPWPRTEAGGLPRRRAAVGQPHRHPPAPVPDPRLPRVGAALPPTRAVAGPRSAPGGHPRPRPGRRHHSPGLDGGAGRVGPWPGSGPSARRAPTSWAATRPAAWWPTRPLGCCGPRATRSAPSCSSTPPPDCRCPTTTGARSCSTGRSVRSASTSDARRRPACIVASRLSLRRAATAPDRLDVAVERAGRLQPGRAQPRHRPLRRRRGRAAHPPGGAHVLRRPHPRLGPPRARRAALTMAVPGGHNTLFDPPHLATVARQPSPASSHDLSDASGHGR